MKKSLILAVLVLAQGTAASAASPQKVTFPKYTFTTVKENPVTPVKDQFKSGTCWAFSAMGFLESESIRINKIKDKENYPDFSEFFIISHSYMDRAVKYVRLDGKMNLAAGSFGGDVFHVISDYGMCPQGVMTGMNYGTQLPEQRELDSVLKAYADAVVKNPNGKLTTAWKRGFQGILDAYLGKCPEKFSYKGKEYTPASFRDAMGIKVEDYVALTSFTHHPFYTSFPIEVEDNWRWDPAFNIPIDEMMKIIDDAILNGYTVFWAADVSHSGFTRTGLGILVDLDASKKAIEMLGSDQEHWVGKSVQKDNDTLRTVVEYTPSQERRQTEFDDKTLTDDHGMLIYGIAKDQNGKKYYMVKNSWGDKPSMYYNGIWYVTEAYVKAQTIDITVHRDAVPKSLLNKMK